MHLHSALYIRIKYEKSAILKSILLKSTICSSYVTMISRQKKNKILHRHFFIQKHYALTYKSIRSRIITSASNFPIEFFGRILNFPDQCISTTYIAIIEMFFSEFLFYVTNFCHKMYSKNTRFIIFLHLQKLALLCLFVHTRVSKYILK